MTLADALVHDSAGQGGEAHWNEEAKALIAGLILYAVVHEDREHRTLATVRDYLTLAPKDFADLLVLMQDSRSEEHTSELQSLMRISYAVFCLKKKKRKNVPQYTHMTQRKDSEMNYTKHTQIYKH